MASSSVIHKKPPTPSPPPTRRTRVFKFTFLLVSILLLIYQDNSSLTALDTLASPSPSRRASSSPQQQQQSTSQQPLLSGMYACSVPDSPIPSTWPPCTDAEGWELEQEVQAQWRKERGQGGGACAATGNMHGPSSRLQWPTQEGGLLPAPHQCLSLGTRHTLVITAVNASGAPLCTGGSFLEAHLHSPRLRYRPRVKDLGNGTYLLEALLPDDPLLYKEAVTLKVVQLYTAFGGFTLNGDWFYNRPDDTVLEIQLTLTPPGECRGSSAGRAEGSTAGSSSSSSGSPAILPLPTIPCSSLPFTSEPFWEGHWVRLDEAPHIPPYPGGRGPSLSTCPPGLCSGDPSTTLWSRWVYRLNHCHFHLFSPAAARGCLNGTNLWGSGDSNWVDSQRNLLAHTLGLDVEGWLIPDDFVIHGKSNDMRGGRDPPRVANAPGAVGLVRGVWSGDYVAWADLSPPQGTDTVGGGSWTLGIARPMGGEEAFGTGTAQALAHSQHQHHHHDNLTFRFGGIYNGAPDDEGRNFGLACVYHGGWKGRHYGRWSGHRARLEKGEAGRGVEGAPTLMVINSGLHDGLRFALHPFCLKDYLLVASDMVDFWDMLRNSSATYPTTPSKEKEKEGGKEKEKEKEEPCLPRTIWKHTVAPAGPARELKANPHKMEHFNRLMVGELVGRQVAKEKNSRGGAAGTPLATRRPRHHPSCPLPFQSPARESRWEFLDTYDMTFPFHYDNEFTDGGHYGRWNCPGRRHDRCDGVDLMVLQVLLNGMCTPEEASGWV